MKIYLKEKLGTPELFTGRKKELSHFLKWIEKIKRELSLSTAIVSRRKTGKTALLHRLYNITFQKNDGVIPFYFEVKERKQWIVPFSRDFFLSFIFQYIAFKTRKPQYIYLSERAKKYELAVEIAKKENLEYLVQSIRWVQETEQEEDGDAMWDIVHEAPRLIALEKDERILQMIDEFQFINRHIYADKEKTRPVDDMAASYFHTCEYKNAPLLITGSWVGWLMTDIREMLPGRFIDYPFDNLPRDEAVEMIYKYAELEEIPVAEETVYIMAEFSEGNPFYISSMFRSICPDKDLTTKEGLLKTLSFETLDPGGIIRSVWLEYIGTALPAINDVYAKKIIFFLAKNRDREVKREELYETFQLDMPHSEFDKKMKALVMSDVINSGLAGYKYFGIRDKIFDKVFLGQFAEDIEELVEELDVEKIYRHMLDDLEGKYNRVVGKLNQKKGLFAEYVFIDNFKYRASQQKFNALFKSLFHNLPGDFDFTEYETVWTYTASPVHKRDIQVDLFARAKQGNYSLVGEVKNRKKKFSIKEAKEFLEKAKELKELEEVEKVVYFVYCTSGFYKNTLDFMEKNQMAWCEDGRLLNREFN
ncbi:MAG: hypothetical protein GY859_07695 [Desulfobacterales bacterium]|nr:hypothetical protein [Desulfobacterales bacterium]